MGLRLACPQFSLPSVGYRGDGNRADQLLGGEAEALAEVGPPLPGRPRPAASCLMPTSCLGLRGVSVGCGTGGVLSPWPRRPPAPRPPTPASGAAPRGGAPCLWTWWTGSLPSARLLSPSLAKERNQMSFSTALALAHFCYPFFTT